tara:strand:+ start:316 stop:717 length:402 start_codon:yes stop_codon:yes gene_type:complete
MIKDKDEFEDIHFTKIELICAELELPQDIAILSFDLWLKLLMRVPRTPIRLLCDCIYLVAFMTGHRRSIKSMADAAKKHTGFRVRVMSKDNRREGTRWVETKAIHPIILEVIPDEESLNLLLAEYPSKEEDGE